LAAAFSKYGEESFEFVVLEDVPLEMLDDRERAWIKHYNSSDRRFGYNKDDGGKVNRSMSAETRLKISRASMGNKNMLGKVFTLEHRRRLSEAKLGSGNPNYGKRRAVQTRLKISQAHAGVPLSKSHREALKNAWASRSREVSDETRAKIADAVKKSWVKRRQCGSGHTYVQV